MTSTENLLKTLPNDIGGLSAERVERVEHQLKPWEKRCHALADVLDFHKIINTEEKRRGVEALGSRVDQQAHILRALDSSLRQYSFPEANPHAGGSRAENGRGGDARWGVKSES